jgi:hypothetical protein
MQETVRTSHWRNPRGTPARGGRGVIGSAKKETAHPARKRRGRVKRKTRISPPLGFVRPHRERSLTRLSR